MKNLTEGLKALTVEAEQKEIEVCVMCQNKERVKLKRTFNQSDFQGGFTKFWRVIGPANHPNVNSDLSLEGLKEWGII